MRICVCTKIEINNEYNLHFLQNTRLILKSVMNLKLYLPRQKGTMNENIHFLQNTMDIEKVSWLKMYLPRQKWTMNETFIFLEIRTVSKGLETDAVFTKTEMKQWMKHSFSSKYDGCWKVSRLKLYLPRKKWKTDNVLLFLFIYLIISLFMLFFFFFSFFQKVCLWYNSLIPVSFLYWSRHFYNWWFAKLCRRISMSSMT